MTRLTRSRRGALVAGALTTVLLVPLLGMSPALAAGETPLTSFVFTDGNTTGREQTYDGGTDVSFVLNGETSGAFEFTGCVAVMTNGNYPGTEFTTTSVTTFTWTAGTNLETLLPGLIDLSPATETTYYIDVFFDINQIAGATCHSIWVGTGEGTLYGHIGDATLTMGAYVAPATPPLTSIQVTDGATEPSDEASFAAGSSVTVVLNDATTGDFSFTGCWLVVVNDDFSTATGPSTSASTTWTAGTPVDTLFPSIDLTPDESTRYDVFVWTFAGQEAGVDCRADEENFTLATILMDIEVASDPAGDPAAKLAATGADDITSAISLGGLAAMLLGGVLLIRRNRAVSIR